MSNTVLLLFSSVSLILSAAFATSTNSPASIRNKRICRSCGQLAQVVDKRMEETKANPRVIQVASRIGADGRPITGRKIDYLSSEARFFDVFTDICEGLGYADKSACYLITNDYEDQLKEWFNSESRDEEGFLSSFCFKELPLCTKEVHDASLSDIEMENYEEDKDKIDDDFMPEAKEEAIKAEEEGGNFATEAVEKVKDIRDNLYDLWDSIDEKGRQFLMKNLFENEKFRPYLVKHLKQENFEVLAKNWYFAVLSILISMLLPLIYVSFLQKREIKRDESNQSTSKSRSSKKTTKSSLKVPSVSIETSESDAAEADDETSGKTVRKSGRSSRILSDSPTKSRVASKRNSRSQAD